MDYIFVPIMKLIVSGIRVITTLTRPVSEWILSILYTIVVGRTKRLPPINNRILLMSAVELAERIRKRRIKAEDVMAAYIQRIEDTHPMLNAMTDHRFDDAMIDAVAVDQFLARGEKSEDQIAKDTPLLGVPFTCKEVIGVKGLAQACGIYWARNRKAEEDGETTSLYRRAGAIPVVVTNVPEFGMWWESANIAFGWTKNPYDNKRTVGGSSGGEGSIITSCGPPIGIGNDIAGSIRIPASFCGIYGHKPTKRLISNKGDWPGGIEAYNDFISTGPMCRYVADLPVTTRILCGENASKVPWDTKINFKRVKFFYIEEFPGWLLSATSDIKSAVRKAVKHFEEQYGVRAVKLDLPELKYGFYIWECKLLETGGPPFIEALEGASGYKISLTWEFIKSLFRASEHTWPALYFAAVDRRKKDKFYYQCLEMFKSLKSKLEDHLQGDSILLLPTHPDPPPHYLMTIPKYPNIAYTCIFNILGYPSSQIPAGLSLGVPIGLQAISSQYKDHLTVATAVELDKVFRGWINPCPVSL